jgi:hypothetical protein
MSAWLRPTKFHHDDLLAERFAAEQQQPATEGAEAQVPAGAAQVQHRAGPA